MGAQIHVCASWSQDGITSVTERLRIKRQPATLMQTEAAVTPALLWPNKPSDLEEMQRHLTRKSRLFTESACQQRPSQGAH